MGPHSVYQHQVHCTAAELDLDFWRAPEGVSIPDDELDFLLIPDAVENRAIFEVAKQVLQHQRDEPAEAITSALIVTMGGMLPGVLLHDHLFEGREPGTPAINFGTIGVSLYAGPGVLYDEPLIEEGSSIKVEAERVLLIDDLVDSGGTLAFLKQHMAERGAISSHCLAVYVKPKAREVCPADFYFGELAQDTWLITPRELVETLRKRVPVWKERGASEAECRRRLVELIGYPPELADYYLPGAYAGEP